MKRFFDGLGANHSALVCAFGVTEQRTSGLGLPPIDLHCHFLLASPVMGEVATKANALWNRLNGNAKIDDYDESQSAAFYISKLIDDDNCNTVLWNMGRMQYRGLDDLIAEAVRSPYVASDLKFKTTCEYLTTRDWRQVPCRPLKTPDSIHDKQVKAKKPGKMPGSPILAPQGGTVGKNGKVIKTGQYTGGLDPLVVKPTPRHAPRQVISTIFQIDSAPQGEEVRTIYWKGPKACAGFARRTLDVLESCSVLQPLEPYALTLTHGTITGHVGLLGKEDSRGRLWTYVLSPCMRSQRDKQAPNYIARARWLAVRKNSDQTKLPLANVPLILGKRWFDNDINETLAERYL